MRLSTIGRAARDEAGGGPRGNAVGNGRNACGMSSRRGGVGRRADIDLFEGLRELLRRLVATADRAPWLSGMTASNSLGIPGRTSLSAAGALERYAGRDGRVT